MEIKPYFCDKGSMVNKIMLVEKDKNLSKEKKAAKLMNNYFINIKKTLNLKS